MKRILVVECMREISSFNPQQSGYEDFDIRHGAEILEQRGTNQGVLGVLSVFDAGGDIGKSPHTGNQMFDAWTDANFNVDAPGATSTNLKSLGHTICRRPVYPLDEDVGFSQVATFDP